MCASNIPTKAHETINKEEENEENESVFVNNDGNVVFIYWRMQSSNKTHFG